MSRWKVAPPVWPRLGRPECRPCSLGSPETLGSPPRTGSETPKDLLPSHPDSGPPPRPPRLLHETRLRRTYFRTSVVRPLYSPDRPSISPHPPRRTRSGVRPNLRSAHTRVLVRSNPSYGPRRTVTEGGDGMWVGVGSTSTDRPTGSGRVCPSSGTGRPGPEKSGANRVCGQRSYLLGVGDEDSVVGRPQSPTETPPKTQCDGPKGGLRWGRGTPGRDPGGSDRRPCPLCPQTRTPPIPTTRPVCPQMH